MQSQGDDRFSRKELDAIADGLECTVGGGGILGLLGLKHHHRNAVTGNYDANVLLAALASRGFDAKWYDKRRGAASLVEELASKSSIGIIANASSSRLWGMWKGRHWIALRSVGGVWYNLDSDLASPMAISNEQELVGFLDGVLAAGGELFLVSRSERFGD